MPNELKIEEVKISALHFADYNPRAMTEREAAALKDSMVKFGIVDPIIVNKNPARQNIIIGGHQRVRTAMLLGMDTVPVVYLDLEPDKEKELNLRLNKNNGHWDVDMLASFDPALLEVAGFDKGELAKLFHLGAKDDEFDPGEKLLEPETQPGDLFQLGDHRLLCGDATKNMAWAKLLEGQKAMMLFTDPPYNMNYTGGADSRRGGIMNDRMSQEHFRMFLELFCRNALQGVQSDFYICMATNQLHTLYDAFTIAGGHWQTFIIWVKDKFTLSGNNFQKQYEPILYGYNPDGERYWRGARNIPDIWRPSKLRTMEFNGVKYVAMADVDSDVWEHDRPAKSPEHPTMKPVELCGHAIENSSRPDDIVVDCFAGSGSTMVACEQLKRKCYMIEMDAHYCDVILQRYRVTTGKEPKKLNT